MSGPIEQYLLAVFAKHPDVEFSTSDLVCGFYGLDDDSDTHWPFTTAQQVAVRRRLEALAKAGKVNSWGRRFRDHQARWSSLSAPEPQAGWSDHKLAQQVGVSASTINRARRAARP
jgi:hypothetical protein